MHPALRHVLFSKAPPAVVSTDPAVTFNSHNSVVSGSPATIPFTVSVTDSTLIFPLVWRASAVRTISSATFNGSSCTVDHAGGGGNQSAGIVRIANPGAGTYDLVVTFSGAIIAMAAGCYGLSNATTLADAQIINTLSGGTGTITISATGASAVVCGFLDNGTGSSTWDLTTGTVVMTEDADTVFNTSRSYAFGSRNSTTTISSGTVIGDSSLVSTAGSGIAVAYTA